MGCPALKSIIIPNSVTTIYYDAFLGCGLTGEFVIPNSVVDIGPAAFSYCKDLTSVIIGNSVDTIGQEAFMQCKELKRVKIGKSVAYIGYHAFTECDSIETVTCLAAEPPKLVGDGCFTGTTYHSADLKVPCESLDTYRDANGWKKFTNILAIDDTPGDANGDGNVNIEDVTALINILLSVNTPSNGIDVDGDGKVNIDDVTALINYLLKGTW